MWPPRLESKCPEGRETCLLITEEGFPSVSSVESGLMCPVSEPLSFPPTVLCSLARKVIPTSALNTQEEKQPAFSSPKMPEQRSDHTRTFNVIP